MLGWAIGFFVAALIAALFGFGAIASTFTSIALILFWVFVVLFAVTLIMSLFGRAHISADGHATSSNAPGIGLLAVAVGLGVLVYAWMDNHWTAEKVGRSLDRTAAQITADAGDAVDDAGHAGTTIRRETGEALDNTQHAVEPEHENTDQGK